MPRILYHFPTSPYSRRARLMLAHKSIGDVELRDARANAAFRDEARALSPNGTVPVFVNDDGTVVGDSLALSYYLDALVPAHPLWPVEPAARAMDGQITTLFDTFMTNLVDLGARYFALRDSAGWIEVKTEMLGRAQGAINKLATMNLEKRTTWGTVEMTAITAVLWMEGLPARAVSFPLAKNILELGWTLPPSLARAVDRWREHPDVRAL